MMETLKAVMVGNVKDFALTEIGNEMKMQWYRLGLE